ncbi:MAG: Rpn family recombination-promoting nuclease/putative transposase [Methanobrevibacter sp.]|jgi:predicted transposase/invertase (TIGR01784 family)|nr:Rpn family recombination-promoting nuclease/putative transposase [Candidatus Methanoflexus mossambicus]
MKINEPVLYDLDVVLESDEVRNNRKMNYSPLNDFLFKRYMGNEEVSKYFIDAILDNFDFRKTEDFRIIQNTFMKSTQDEKMMIVDFMAEDETNRKFIVEMQRQNEKCFKRRANAYLDRRVLESIDKYGYENINMHFLISIVDFKFCQDGTYDHNIYKRDRTNSNCKITDIPQIIVLDLVKFRNKKNRNKIDLNNPLHQIMVFFNKNTLKEEFKEVILMTPQVKLAHTIAQNALETPEDISQYKYIEGRIQSYKNELKYREEEGRKEGRKEGKEEEKRSFALNLKNKDFDIELISELT